MPCQSAYECISYHDINRIDNEGPVPSSPHLSVPCFFCDIIQLFLHLFQARRSLVFAKSLRKQADKFRSDFFDSNDKSDLTPYNDNDWRVQIPKDGSARGGNYLAVHMRRGDFVFSGREGVPTIKAIKRQIKKLLKELKLKKVFLATDGSDEGKYFSLFHFKL